MKAAVELSPAIGRPAENAVAAEEIHQRDAAEPASALPQEFAPVDLI
jgi:hypothetical protein